MPIAILVHGGAGAARPDDDPATIEAGCRAATARGFELLRAGANALDAVVEAVVALEDDPQFNAGTGSCLTWEGDVEMDASLMDGHTLNAGAVSLVRTVKNPVRLARAVMERTPHLFLAAEGAEALAGDAGLVRVRNEALVTPRARARWEEARAQQPRKPGGGTVGAVAVDAHGHVAAATSTGGMILKRKGRIGDTPLIGAGTYADDLGGAASATGHGEAIIRVTLTRTACDLMRSGMSPNDAARAAIGQLGRIDGEAGLICVDPLGRLGAAFNTERMSRAWIDSEARTGSGFRSGGP